METKHTLSKRTKETNGTFCRYTMAGDICIVKVYFSTCDHPRLNPIRVIIDEVTACNGQWLHLFYDDASGVYRLYVFKCQ